MILDTIAAISTASAPGAISIVRMSGSEAIDIANTCTKKDITQCTSHTVTYTYFIDPLTNETIDEVLVTIFRAPKTYTKEDIVEISCHGGVYITRKILTLLLANGARLANPGEFTQKAFLNGRIDLTQAEAVMDMIDASNQTNAKLAIEGIRGSISALLTPLIQKLLDIIALIEVNIDYPEYDDVEILTNESVLPQAKQFKSDIELILRKSESGQILRDGIKTAIIGKPNVGKSSLLNALLEEEKAIVTDVAGTTRDIVEGSIQLNHIRLNLVDTAGIRDTEDVVEKIGIERSIQAINQAQLVLLVLDSSNQLDEQDQLLLNLTKDKTRLIVYNKADLCEGEGLRISAKDHQIDPLLNEIETLYQKHAFALTEPTLNNERHIACMRSALSSMNQAIDSLKEGIELDMVTIDLQKAYTSLKEILGEVSRDDLLDTLFSNFCLGK